MLFKAGLIHKNEIVTLAVLLGVGGVGAPLFEPRHLLRQVEFLAAFGFHNPNHAVGDADDEVGRVIGKVPVRLHVIELEANGEIVLGERGHVRRGFEKGGEP